MLDKRSHQYQQAGVRSPSRLAMVVVAVVALAAIGTGIWMVVGSDEADDLATDLADDWLVAWNGTDPEAVVALYTDDGVHVPPAAWNLDDAEGRDELRAHAVAFIGSISESTRTGDVVADASEEGYTFPIAFRADGKNWVAEIEIELDADRASRVAFVTVTDTALAPATALVDEWMARWSETDAEAIAALYTTDGIHVPPPEWNLADAVGRDAIVAHAASYAASVSNGERTGDPVSAGVGTVYRFPVRFDASGDTYDGEVELELAGELASRFEFLTVTQID